MAELLKYSCPCCGGAIEYDSSLQKLRCPFCNTEFDAESLRYLDEDTRQCSKDEAEWDTNAGKEWCGGEADGVAVYTCDSCGGELIAEQTTGSMRCPYCDSPVIIKDKFSGVLRPDLVLPFKLDKNAAKEAFKRHLLGKRLLPKVFKDESHIDEIKGVYVPFWIFDADAGASVRYRATKSRVWTSGKYDYTETSHFSLFRSGDMSFSGIPADGSSKMPDDLMESLEPFSLSDAVDFQTAYLSGFVSDRYDVLAEERTERVTKRIKESAERELRKTVIGYGSVIPDASSVKLSRSCTKYVLYPVWIMNTSWNGERYLFAMNGQTGKFVGNLPMDKKAFFKYLFTIGGAASCVLYLLMTLLFFMFLR